MHRTPQFSVFRIMQSPFPSTPIFHREEDEDKGYKTGLAQLDMETLQNRREELCLNFANKCSICFPPKKLLLVTLFLYQDNCHSPTQLQFELGGTC